MFQRDDTVNRETNLGEVSFEERRNHRTQLVVATENTAGPRPYYYKTFSTVGGNVPGEQSPIVDGSYTSVCPVCRHPAYCTLNTSVII
eukprot:SAG22_NODE_12937_length_424_cov_0.827692_1_plen_87_part_01